MVYSFPRPDITGFLSEIKEKSYQHVYNYSDHLGNNRVIYTFDSAAATPGLVILEESNYYPYGLRHMNYNMTYRTWSTLTEGGPLGITQGSVEYAQAPGKFKYKYNRQEWQCDFGYDMFDYGARHYDPTIGRWVCLDAYAGVYVRYSPYAYVSNNPIKYIDPDGNHISDPDGLAAHWLQEMKASANQIKVLISQGAIEEELGNMLLSWFEMMLTNFQDIDESDQVYEFKLDSSINDVVDGVTVNHHGLNEYNWESHSVVIRLGAFDSALITHEITHAFQFENGKTSYRKDSKLPVLYDITDETEAYNNQNIWKYGKGYYITPNKELDGFMLRPDDNYIRHFSKLKLKDDPYGTLPDGPININSKDGKILRSKTISAGAAGIPVNEVYFNWERDYSKGKKSKR
ncbi:RHS repeat-associated core domain-containing protein [Flavobacterium sp.]|uniref:RHS repeat protein n=1 Tax=Flavobacterium sp. TaxID=239 RepID=UPI0026021869|nr:RHS repeat-associated core domain-containing protein [Flavobacterium sp.]